MDTLLRSLAFFLVVPAMGCGGATRDADASDGGPGTTRSDDGGLSGGYPAGMIAASSSSANGLSFFAYDTTTGFVPIGALSGDSWAKTGFCGSVAFDGARNLYVGCEGSPQQPSGRILVFANGSVGDAQPIRSVTSPDVATGALSNIAVDPAGTIYVVTQRFPDDDGGSTTTATLSVFGKSSDTAPIRTIDLSASSLFDSSGVALDAAGNVYVSSVLGPIEEFSAGASGDVSPLRSFGGSDGFMGETGLAIDPSGRLYVTTYDDPAPTVTPASLFVFGPDGAVERTVGGPATGLSLAGGMAIDRAGRMYVSDLPGRAGTVGLHVFGAGASGNVPPEATLPGVGEYGFAVAP
jgi:hypothetical protein